MYEDLVKRLRTECTLPFQTLQLMREAADAIEGMSKEVDKWKAKYADCFRYSMELFEENQNLQDVFRPLHEMPLPSAPKEETC